MEHGPPSLSLLLSVRSDFVTADQHKQSGGSLLKGETELGPFSADK